MGREMARLAERKAAAETEYDQTVAKLWDEYLSLIHIYSADPETQ